jgi:hypothetical protein
VLIFKNISRINGNNWECYEKSRGGGKAGGEKKGVSQELSA